MDQGPRQLRIQFSASGSEYFRIWIVNLLLIVVTLGFYLPFAKARRLRYFYANTAIAGEPLAFHGDPWKMFRGYLLMLVLFAAYGLSGHVSGWATLIAFLILGLLWPALWRSSLRFRLANTSWRGLRFGFQGTLAGAYQAMLPFFVPGLIVVAASAWALDGVAQDDQAAMAAGMAKMGIWFGLAGLLSLLLLPWAFWLLKRYQHAGYRYANQQARFEVGAWAFYKLGLKIIGLSLLAFGSFFLLMMVMLPAAGSLLRGAGQAGAVGVGLLFAVAYVTLLSLIGAYMAARLQNLCWKGTSSQALRFDSQLGVTPLTSLMMKNLLLIVITLGLYRPFAVVAVARMRLQAVSVDSLEDPDGWHVAALRDGESASGEMAGDFFGFDLGL